MYFLATGVCGVVSSFVDRCMELRFYGVSRVFALGLSVVFSVLTLDFQSPAEYESKALQNAVSTEA